MTDTPRNRRIRPEPGWRLPITPPAGVGVVIPSCEDRTDLLTVPIRSRAWSPSAAKHFAIGSSCWP